jgi:hypothetical protein
MIGVARSGMDDSVWLDPHLYGWRFNERPQLMGWTVGILGLIFGGINQYVARAPTVLSLLGSCLLVFWLVRRYASALAGLFAAICFISSPMILQKVVTAEPDFLLCIILFATFVVWWESFAVGKLGALRWLGIGALLASAGFVKGPQPLAFFGLGVGAFYLARRRWRDLFGLAFAGAIAALMATAWYWWVYHPGDIEMWLSHSKINGRIDPSLPRYVADSVVLLVTLLLEFLPGLILVVPFCFLALRESPSKEKDLILALLLYAACCSDGARDLAAGERPLRNAGYTCDSGARGPCVRAFSHRETRIRSVRAPGGIRPLALSDRLNLVGHAGASGAVPEQPRRRAHRFRQHQHKAGNALRLDRGARQERRRLPAATRPRRHFR